MYNAIGTIVLAAGASRRFGASNKLTAKLGERPLLEHALITLNSLPFHRRILVTSPETSPVSSKELGLDWEVLGNPDANSGQSTSLKLAIRTFLDDPSIQFSLVALADMPFVSKAHFVSMCALANNRQPAIVSTFNQALMPPIILHRSLFQEVLKLNGDRGANALLRSFSEKKEVPLSAIEAMDIDTHDDLALAERFIRKKSTSSQS